MHLQVPPRKVRLATFPTPVHPWHPPGLPDSVKMLIKRDDLSGMQLSGNKVKGLTLPPKSLLASGLATCRA